MEINRVCVFCASSSKTKDIYVNEAQLLGKYLSESNIAINYGGGAVGLMGAIADSILQNGGSIKGIIPKFMVEVEWQHKKVEDMVLVDTMWERKQLLVENTDAVIALPGGTGTLEELFEVASNKKLGLYNKPIILLNTNNFYDPLIKMMDQLVEESFMRREHKNLWTVVSSAKDVIPAIEDAKPWHEDAIKIATV